MRTNYADNFDSRPRRGTGSNKVTGIIAATNETNGQPLAEAVSVAASHMAELARQMEIHTGGLISYNEVNPPGMWGRATAEARKHGAMLDPRSITKVNKL